MADIHHVHHMYKFIMNAMAAAMVYIGSAPPSNSHGQDNYIFSRESL